jgi:hypothetical protein
MTTTEQPLDRLIVYLIPRSVLSDSGRRIIRFLAASMWGFCSTSHIEVLPFALFCLGNGSNYRRQHSSRASRTDFLSRSWPIASESRDSIIKNVSIDESCPKFGYLPMASMSKDLSCRGDVGTRFGCGCKRAKCRPGQNPDPGNELLQDISTSLVSILYREVNTISFLLCQLLSHSFSLACCCANEEPGNPSQALWLYYGPLSWTSHWIEHFRKLGGLCTETLWRDLTS